MVSVIVALANGDGIGSQGDLPWAPTRLQGDMSWFSAVTQTKFRVLRDRVLFEKTTDNTVVMGRKTWESIPQRYRPLRGRENVVLSRTPRQEKDVLFVSSLSPRFLQSRRVFIIGGHDVYRLAIRTGLAEYVFVTRIVSSPVFSCDVFFPEIDWSVYRAIDITRQAAEMISPRIRERSYNKEADVFCESGIKYKMFLYVLNGSKSDL
ncbi:MAG: dihydrofolate reductase [Amphiamblys sp. WSBS2006]|nr:MAG: dihydrofolate reductase [Amphiamblys sp. WSBS2006]